MNPGIFADTSETEAWLDALKTVTDDERNRIQIPDESTWREWLKYGEVPEQEIEEVVATTPRPQTNPELYDLLQRGAALVVGAMGKLDPGFRFAALADFNHPEHRFF